MSDPTTPKNLGIKVETRSNPTFSGYIVTKFSYTRKPDVMEKYKDEDGRFAGAVGSEFGPTATATLIVKDGSSVLNAMDVLTDGDGLKWIVEQVSDPSEAGTSVKQDVTLFAPENNTAATTVN